MGSEKKSAHLLEACACRWSRVALEFFGPQEVGKGKDRQHFPMAGSSREETSATSKQKLSILGLTAGKKPTGYLLLIQVYVGLLLLEQQRLKGAMCH